MVLVATVENLLVVNRDTSRSQPSSGKKSMSSGRSPVSACLQARLAVFDDAMTSCCFLDVTRNIVQSTKQMT